MAWTDRYISVAGGGAHDGTTEADAWTLAEAIAAPYAAGQRINVQVGTYANTTTGRTFATAGTTTAPCWFRGYKTTIGDLDDGVTLPRSLQDGVNLPLITFTTGQMVVSGAFHIFSNIDITSQCTTSGGAVSATGGNTKMFYCRVENTAANTAARAFTVLTNAPATLVNCRFKATTTALFAVLFSALGHLIGCHVIGGATALQCAGSVMYRSVIEGFTTNGVVFATGASTTSNLTDCTIYAAATNGLNISVLYTNGHLSVVNSIIGGCTNGITAVSGTNAVTIFRTHFYGCTNNLVNITELAAVGDDLGILIGLFDNDTDPFVAKASSDFSLTSTAIDRAAGFPGVFEGQTAMVGYPDIGAVSHAENAAGGGLNYPRHMSGGLV